MKSKSKSKNNRKANKIHMVVRETKLNYFNDDSFLKERYRKIINNTISHLIKQQRKNVVSVTTKHDQINKERMNTDFSFNYPYKHSNNTNTNLYFNDNETKNKLKVIKSI